jgi:hypothetical protein
VNLLALSGGKKEHRGTNAWNHEPWENSRTENRGPLRPVTMRAVGLSQVVHPGLFPNLPALTHIAAIRALRAPIGGAVLAEGKTGRKINRSPLFIAGNVAAVHRA